MKHLTVILVLLTALLLAACHNNQSHPCPQEDVLYQLECIANIHPDSTIRILDTIDVSRLSKKERAHYCLLKVQANDALFDYSEETDSLLRIAQSYYIGSSDQYFEALTCEAIARVSFKRGSTMDYKLEWELKGLQSIENCQHIDERLLQCQPEGTTEQEMINDYKYKLMWRLGMDYGMGDYWDESLDCFKKVYPYYEERQNSLMCTRAAYCLANCYSHKHENDSCLKYLNLSLQEAERFGNPEVWALSYYAVSNYYLDRAQETEDNSEKERLLRISISEAFKGLALLGNGPKVKDALYNCLSKDYFLLDLPDSAVYYAENLLTCTEMLYGKILPNLTNTEVYQLLYKSYETIGNYEKALHYAQLCLEMKDELSDQSKNMEQIKGDYEKRMDVQRMESEQQIKRYRLYLLLALSVLALVVVIWISFRYRKNKEIEDLKFQEELQRIQTAFEQTSQNSKNLLCKRVTDIYRSKADNALEQIIHEFELQYPSAIENISNAYPNLNKTEKHVIILSFLNFRAKEEADLLRLSENTVMKYRSNIKKKVDENLYMLFL